MARNRDTETLMINSAIKMAYIEHEGKFRKGTDIPYISHPLKVQTLLNVYEQNSEVQVAGILHDVIEDSYSQSLSSVLIKILFGKRVFYIVKALTLNKKLGWKGARLDFFQQYTNKENFKGKEELWIELWTVKAADVIANLEDIYLEFRDKGDEVFNKFNATKEDEAWYYAETLYWAQEITKDNKLVQEMIDRGFNIYKDIFPIETLNKYKPNLNKYSKGEALEK